MPSWRASWTPAGAEVRPLPAAMVRPEAVRCVQTSCRKISTRPTAETAQAAVRSQGMPAT